MTYLIVYIFIGIMWIIINIIQKIDKDNNIIMIYNFLYIKHPSLILTALY